MPVDRVNVGSVEIVAVSDGQLLVPPWFFFIGVPPEQSAAALGADLRPDGTFACKYGSFLVRSSGKTVLVDTGDGSKRPGTGGKLLANLEALGVQPADIDIVVNTHLHVDHVGWNCRERDGGYVPTFPNAEYWIARDEWDYWTDPAVLADGGDAHLQTDVLPLRDSPQLRLVDGEAAVTPELSLLPTPGHTPGHVSIGVASAGEHAVILGDVAHHPLHLERLWIAAVDELPRVSRRTKRELAQRLIDDQILVAAGHFTSGSFGRLVLADGRRSWQPLSN
jgi:glyoxylase-like metal-dependent hydrolase (beta-lactamase superfamily II)